MRQQIDPALLPVHFTLKASSKTCVRTHGGIVPYPAARKPPGVRMGRPRNPFALNVVVR